MSIMHKLLLMFTIFLAVGSISVAQPIPERYLTGLPFSMPEVVIPHFPERAVRITEFGAVANGKTLNTAAFRDAISTCAKSEGGHVIVPPGMWLTGPIKLESNIDLHLEIGAVILFSTRFEDYPVVPRSPKSKTFRCTPPISGFDLENVAITGNGVIDGSGEAWRYAKKDKLTAREWKELVSSGGIVNPSGTEWWPSKEAMNGEKYLEQLRKEKKEPTAEDYAVAREFLRPDMVELTSCRNVLFEGPTFRNSPRFNIHPIECENVVIRNITVRNPWNAQNGDGIDIGSSHTVVIYNTVVDVGDDGICLKPSSFSSRKDWNVACENIVIADCIVYRAHGGFVVGSETYGGMRNVSVRNCTFIDTDVGLRFKTARDRGGITEKIFIDGILMKNVANEAILFDSFYAGTSPEERVKSEENVRKAEPVTNRTPQFRDISIKNIVCVGAEQAISMFGLPESPVRNITLSNLSITARKGIFLLDVDGISFTHFDIRPAAGPIVTLTASKNVTITQGAVPAGTEIFLSVRDDETRNVRVGETDVTLAKMPVQLRGKARKDAVDIQ